MVIVSLSTVTVIVPVSGSGEDGVVDCSKSPSISNSPIAPVSVKLSVKLSPVTVVSV